MLPNNRLQPTAFPFATLRGRFAVGAGMRGAACQLSFWLSKRVLPEPAAAEPQAVGQFTL
jgi:hypothetical protein